MMLFTTHFTSELFYTKVQYIKFVKNQIYGLFDS